MSPLLDTPATRREAIASLLAMLAFVLGTGESEAKETCAESAQVTDPVDQPHPGSGRSWFCDLHFAADEHHLPIPRNPDLDSQLTYDGHTLRLDVELPPDPVWIDHVEQPNTPLGSFVFTGNPAAFLDAISAEGDRVWLKKELEWAKKPYTFCPECLADGMNKGHTGPCPNCDGARWIHFTPEEGQRMVKKKAAKRQRKINRAVKKAAQS